MRARQHDSKLHRPRPPMFTPNHFDKDVVRAAAAGNWVRVFGNLGIVLADKVIAGEHGPCPGCGGKDRLRFDDLDHGTFFCSGGGAQLAFGDGFEFVRHVFGIGFSEAVRRVAHAVGLQDMDAATQFAAPASAARRAVKEAAEKAADDAAALRKILRTVERGSRPSDDGEVATYLRRRGLGAILDELPADLLEHPPAEYWEWPDKLGEFPMMLAVVRSADGEIANVHRTYLHNGAKAPVPEPKKMAKRKKSLSGAAIRLYEPAERLAIAEGIESALAVRAMTGLPVWSCVSATHMPHVVIPPSVRVLDIYADNDEAGLKAAQKLRDRVSADGVTVTVHVPPVADTDPLDWYLKQQAERTCVPAPLRAPAGPTLPPEQRPADLPATAVGAPGAAATSIRPVHSMSTGLVSTGRIGAA